MSNEPISNLPTNTTPNSHTRPGGNAEAGGAQPAPRIRTFLKGVVYYDNRRVSIDCTVRDISDTGARVVFAAPVTVPDHVELFIPQKQRSFAARVERREPVEIGVSFRDQRSGVQRRESDAEIAERVAALEHEVAALRRIVKKLRDKVLPADTSDGI
ncbi:MAG TPA: PilZ domain-containing protein [Pseudolabrys sp.]|nr:PilZ domain-containing protein [Pseudolabrys sp.]